MQSHRHADKQIIVRALRTETLPAAAKRVGVTLRTVKRWRSQDAHFDALCKAAIASRTTGVFDPAAVANPDAHSDHPDLTDLADATAHTADPAGDPPGLSSSDSRQGPWPSDSHDAHSGSYDAKRDPFGRLVCGRCGTKLRALSGEMEAGVCASCEKVIDASESADVAEAAFDVEAHLAADAARQQERQAAMRQAAQREAEQKAAQEAEREAADALAASHMPPKLDVSAQAAQAHSYADDWASRARLLTESNEHPDVIVDAWQNAGSWREEAWRHVPRQLASDELGTFEDDPLEGYSDVMELWHSPYMEAQRQAGAALLAQAENDVAIRAEAAQIDAANVPAEA